ncbi:MAG: PHB depolymerase family esterase [Bacteroidia bacterium]
MHLFSPVAGLCWLTLTLTLSCASADMVKIEDFGPNPGELDMYVFVPDSLAQAVPLVVALHGCTQDAATYARETGWNDLATTHGFVVVYPQQRLRNNLQNCFSWFNEEDINREQGEAKSIKSMIDYMAAQYPIDPQRIHVTGLSAGGCMTAVMLATYPEVFEAGAVMAGIPYKATTDISGALPAMRGEVDQSPEHWSALVAEQHPTYGGEYPRIAIFHGEKDPVVSRQNMNELIEQWTYVHGLADTLPEEQSAFDGNAQVTRLAYRDSAGRDLVLAYEVADMGHAQAVNPGMGPKQGGATGKYAVDVDFFYTYWAAAFFGLIAGD